MTEPFNSGLGGKFVALYYDSKTGAVSFLDGMGVAPGKIPVKKLAGMDPLKRERGYLSACIPGCAAGLGQLHQRWGHLSWKTCVEPARKIATDGYEVPAKQLIVFADKQAAIRRDPAASQLFLTDGSIPKPGTRLTNPDLAHTLQILAEKGAEAFYQGDIAEKLVAASKAGGGYFSLEDFSHYRATVSAPLTTDYKGNRIHTGPSPLTGGGTLLLTLKALEPHDWSGIGRSDFSRIDLVSRVIQQVYPAVGTSFGDSPGNNTRMTGLFTAANYGAFLSRALVSTPENPRQGPFSLTPSGNLNGNTTHFIVVDRDGNIACVTQSLSHHFGAGVVAPGTGILLNNDLGNFSFNNPGSINAVGPGKRPRSTITPVIVTRDGKPILALGSPASQRIPTGVFQVLTSILDFKASLVDAIDEPRFHIRRPETSRSPANELDLETGITGDTVKKLAMNGWKTEAGTQDSYYFAAVNAVGFHPDGTHEAVGDERRTNSAAGE
jgi:gamma-glutamyltranspeptidase/glutathione hydrolase